MVGTSFRMVTSATAEDITLAASHQPHAVRAAGADLLSTNGLPVPPSGPRARMRMLCERDMRAGGANCDAGQGSGADSVRGVSRWFQSPSTSADNASRASGS